MPSTPPSRDAELMFLVQVELRFPPRSIGLSLRKQPGWVLCWVHAKCGVLLDTHNEECPLEASPSFPPSVIRGDNSFMQLSQKTDIFDFFSRINL